MLNQKATLPYAIANIMHSVSCNLLLYSPRRLAVVMCETSSTAGSISLYALFLIRFKMMEDAEGHTQILLYGRDQIVYHVH